MKHQVKGVIKSFKSSKAARRLQKEVDYISFNLVDIFSAYLKFAYTPKAWRVARVLYPSLIRKLRNTKVLSTDKSNIVFTQNHGRHNRYQDKKQDLKRHAYIKRRSEGTA